MRAYEIRYEFIDKKLFYLELLKEVLEKGVDVDFYIDGLIVKLNPSMSMKDIENEIIKKNDEFNANSTFIEIGEKESLLSFAQRISKLACDNNTCYGSIYKNRIIKAVPGSTDFDILYQIVQINTKRFNNGEVDYIDMYASSGSDCMEFGKEIVPFLRRGKNVLAHFNTVEMPFTTEMLDRVTLSNGEITIDARTFTIMISNMLRAQGKYWNSTEGCVLREYPDEEEYGYGISKKHYWDTIARLNR